MKKIILLFLIIVSINYNLNAQIALTGNITTAGVAVYPTHIDSLGKGGLMTLPDLSTRNALPVKRRKQGMMVYVQANDSLYKLTTVDVSLNTGWVALGILTQQKLTDSLNSRLKVTDTLSLSARIDLKANAGSITDVTTLLADKLNIIDTSLLLQKADTATLSNRINLKTNGNQRKSFICDETLAEIAVEEVTKKDIGFKVCNVASQFTPSILEVANLVASKLSEIGEIVIVSRNTMDHVEHSNLTIKSFHRDLPNYQDQEILLHRSLEALIQREMSR